MSWDFELIDGPYGGVTEGPVWDGSGVIFTHIPKSKLLRYDPQKGSSTVFREDTNQANGLAFSVAENIITPPSLLNIFIEIENNFR